MRSIAKLVPAQSFKNNSAAKQSFRVIGTVDIDNNGTLHDLSDVDPFIFLDETSMSGDEPWPFPRHPHSGLVAMTYLLAGEIKPWDNHYGPQPFTNRAGGLYYINSGRGILHEEEPIINGGALRWLQLWMNPGVPNNGLEKAITKMIQPEQIPVHVTKEAKIRLVIGRAYHLESIIDPDWPIQYLHVVLEPNQTITLPIPKTTWQGFFYVLSGSAKFGKNHINGEIRDCLVLGNELSDTVSVVNEQQNIVEFVFLSGQPHQKPFYKILCGGGALIAGSEEAARNAKLCYESTLNDYGSQADLY